MALKMNNVYCGDGFPNLPDFKDLSGGGSGGSAAVMAGQAIRISDISVSNVSYKRINANVDELTIAVDSVTNKLKSLVKGVKDYSTTEQDTGIVDTDGKHVFVKSFDLTFTPGSLVEVGEITNVYAIKKIEAVATFLNMTFPLPYVVSESNLAVAFFDIESGKVKTNAVGSTYTDATGFATVYYTKVS